MEFQEVLKRRRMVRNYTGEPVDPEVLRQIVQAARRAPSAGFSQGQRFVVVTDPEIRMQVAILAEEPLYVADGFEPWISKAPAHVVICTEEDAYHRRYRESDKLGDNGLEDEWEVPYWHTDAGASMMLVLLAAVDAGLAAGFLGVHNIPGLQALLNIPPGVMPIGVVTIGHPAPDRKSGSLKRGWKDESDVIRWQRWDES